MQFPPKCGRMFLVRTSPELTKQKAAYKLAFIKRTLVARESAGYERDDMANDLGRKPDTYRKYEENVQMPMYLLPRFVLLAEVTGDYMLGLSKYKRKPRLKAAK